jgi:hypothetical protein
MALCGIFIGGTAALNTGAFLGMFWGAGIGYGFGSIFAQRHPTRRIIVYWAGTLGLVAPFFGLIIGAGVFLPDYTSLEMAFVALISAGVGALVGLSIGVSQLKGLRRKTQTQGKNAEVGVV